MKNLLKIIILTIFTGFIFSSCSKHMSITKRKYTKGYYVNHSHKRSDVKIQPTVASIKPETSKTEQHVILKHDKEIITTNQETEFPLTAAVTRSEPKTNSQNLNTKYNNTKINSNFYKVKRLDSFPTKIYSAYINKKLSGDASDEALSLVWIIIVIILLVYLLGLVLDGFGLGWAIHILALIALILLILWLLRVV
ncbi:MAG: hypothetical protein ABIP51_17210 [Bacteroidia bacterium]